MKKTKFIVLLVILRKHAKETALIFISNLESSIKFKLIKNIYYINMYIQ